MEAVAAAGVVEADAAHALRTPSSTYESRDNIYECYRLAAAAVRLSGWKSAQVRCVCVYGVMQGFIDSPRALSVCVRLHI